MQRYMDFMCNGWTGGTEWIYAPAMSHQRSALYVLALQLPEAADADIIQGCGAIPIDVKAMGIAMASCANE